MHTLIGWGVRSSGIDLKRIFDAALAATGLVVLAPLLAVLTAIVARLLGRPVLFPQRRPGLHGQAFTLLKFRTMTDERGPDGRLKSDEERLTPFGEWLRTTSLDELPELVNVLRGDLSLVGPRPLLTDYLDRYTPEQARRHEVRPGMTGWAQVNGRNAADWQDRLAMDVWYVDHQSPWLDLRILARTVPAVLRREDVAREGHATVPSFEGDEQTPAVPPRTEGGSG